jgi:DNA-directed RNA polymerase subunit RPC12/RpoP
MSTYHCLRCSAEFIDDDDDCDDDYRVVCLYCDSSNVEMIEE